MQRGVIDTQGGNRCIEEAVVLLGVGLRRKYIYENA